MSGSGEDIEDLEICVREGRRPREVGPYRVSVGNARLQFRPIVALEPVLTGRALRELAELGEPERHACFIVLASGLLEELRLEETVDLREGVERFITFESDRLFRFTINGAEYQWGGPFISGFTLMTLARVDTEQHRVALRRPDGSEHPVRTAGLVDLAGPGVEHFLVVPIG